MDTVSAGPDVAHSNHLPRRVYAAAFLFALQRNADPVPVAKTRSQLNRRLTDGKKLPWPPFGAQWYAGCTTLIIGNSLKAGIRFVAFDMYKDLLADAEGHVSGPATVLAGFGAGATESLFAVTPFESIKTQL